MMVLIGACLPFASGIYALAALGRSTRFPISPETQVMSTPDYKGRAQVIEESGHLIADDGHADVAKGRIESGAGFSFFGVSFVSNHLRRTATIYNGPAFPRPRIPQRRARQAAERRAANIGTRTPPAWAGSINMRCKVPRTNRWPRLDPLQEWSIATAFPKPKGVAEVASVGGFVRIQYHCRSEPLRSLNYPGGWRKCAMRRPTAATWMSVAHRWSSRNRIRLFAAVARPKASPTFECCVESRPRVTPVAGLKECGADRVGPDTSAEKITEPNGEGEVASCDCAAELFESKRPISSPM